MLRRFACMMYEGVLLFGVLFLAGYLFDTLTQSRSGLVLRHTRQAWLFLAVGAYFLVCWRASGQTLPMKTWRIKLVDAHGRPPPVAVLAARYALAWLLPLAAAAGVWAISRWSGYPATLMFIVAAPLSLFAGACLAPDRQFLHDRLLGTRLVQAD